MLTAHSTSVRYSNNRPQASKLEPIQGEISPCEMKAIIETKQSMPYEYHRSSRVKTLQRTDSTRFVMRRRMVRVQGHDSGLPRTGKVSKIAVFHCRPSQEERQPMCLLRRCIAVLHASGQYACLAKDINNQSSKYAGGVEYLHRSQCSSLWLWPSIYNYNRFSIGRMSKHSIDSPFLDQAKPNDFRLTTIKSPRSST